MYVWQLEQLLDKSLFHDPTFQKSSLNINIFSRSTIKNKIHTAQTDQCNGKSIFIMGLQSKCPTKLICEKHNHFIETKLRVVWVDQSVMRYVMVYFRHNWQACWTAIPLLQQKYPLDKGSNFGPALIGLCPELHYCSLTIVFGIWVMSLPTSDN